MSTFGGSNSDFFLDDVNCAGNESNILDCQHPPSTYCRTGSEEAGVICGVTPGNDDYFNSFLSTVKYTVAWEQDYLRGAQNNTLTKQSLWWQLM